MMVANNARTRKDKGAKFQKDVAYIIGEKYPFLEVGKDKDIYGREMGQQGTDLRLSSKAKKFIPFDFELKRQETFNVWSSMSQAESNTEKGRIPLLVFKRNQSKVYACLELKDLLYVMGE